MRLVASILLITACNQGGTARTAVAGSDISAPYHGSSASATPTATGTGVQTSDTNTATSANASSKTLEQCQASNQAWRAVVNSGNSPDDCVDTLESWCCVQSEIDARFPTLKDKIDAELFTELVQNEGLVLYACSTDGNSPPKVTFHTAKVVNGTTTYKTVYTTGVTPSDNSNPVSSCTKVKTSDLTKTSLLLNGEGPARDTFDEIEISP